MLFDMEQVDWQSNKSISECIEYLLENEVNCDVSFKVGEDGEVIKAHKLILSSRSPVFDRMFNGSFCESETDPVIPDVSPEAFRALLRYCYYDSLDVDCDVALTVPYAATKYMLPILEKAARETVIQNLDDSNIWEIMEYSANSGDDELYAGCITYLRENVSETNILDVIKHALRSSDDDLYDYCKQHFKENLSETNILDITKYTVGIADEELRAACKDYLKGHLSGSYIWQVYKYSLKERDREVQELCREYFERDVTMVREGLQSEDFPNIEYEVLLDVLCINDKVDGTVDTGYTPGISISEIELFPACCTWAEAECLRQEIDPIGANKRTVLGECLSLIRFPTMLQKDLITAVYPTGILTQAAVVNLGQYLDREPGSECQVDFPSGDRQFVVTPSGTGSAGTLTSTVYIESEVRVLLSRVWLWLPGGYSVRVRDETSQKAWSMRLDTNHKEKEAGQTCVLPYVDLDPQVLEAGTRYSVTAESTYKNTSTELCKNLITVPGKLDPYKEVKITQAQATNSYIFALTLSLV